MRLLKTSNNISIFRIVSQGVHPEKITTLVTDWRPPTDIVEAFRATGLRVVIATAER